MAFFAAADRQLVDGEKKPKKKTEKQIPTHVPLPCLFLRGVKVQLPVLGSLEDGKVLNWEV